MVSSLFSLVSSVSLLSVFQHSLHHWSVSHCSDYEAEEEEEEEEGDDAAAAAAAEEEEGEGDDDC